MVAAIISGCTKIEVVESVGGKTIPPKIISKVDFTILGAKSTQIPGDTLLYVEVGSQITLKAQRNDSAINIVSWSWNFRDNSTTGTGQYISHNFSTTLLTSLITITGVDDKGKKYERTRGVSTVQNISYCWGIQTLSTSRNTDGSLSVVLACDKRAMTGVEYNSKQYAFVGNVTDLSWGGGSSMISPTDTSYSINNGLIVANSIPGGKDILVRLTLKKGDGFEYQMGLGKVKNANLNWGKFWGAFVSPSNPTLIKFKTLGLQIIPSGS